MAHIYSDCFIVTGQSFSRQEHPLVFNILVFMCMEADFENVNVSSFHRTYCLLLKMGIVSMATDLSFKYSVGTYFMAVKLLKAFKYSLTEHTKLNLSY